MSKKKKNQSNTKFDAKNKNQPKNQQFKNQQNNKNQQSKNQQAKKQVKLEEKPLQLSFKDNLKKKITYFKATPNFRYIKIDKDDEDRLVDCLKGIEDLIKLNYDESTDKEDKQATSQTESSDPLARKLRKEDKKLRTKKRLEIIKKELIFGFNEIVRKLKNNKIVGIVLTAQLTSHVQQTVLELAFNHKVPVLIIGDLEFYKKLFQVSCISCFGLMASTKAKESVFNSFSTTFFEIDKKYKDKGDKGDKGDSKQLELKDDNSQDDESDGADETQSKDSQLKNQLEVNAIQSKDSQIKNQPNKESTKCKKLKINNIPIDQLWMPRRERKSIPNLFNQFKDLDKFNKSDDLLVIKEHKDDYFVKRFF